MVCRTGIPGSRSFYTVKKPILKPDDVRGLRLRVLPGKTAHNMVFTLGGTPTAIAYGDLYEALKKNKVDGAENNAPSLYTSRHYELAKHYSLDEHTRVPDIVVASKKVWDRLDPQVRGWVAQAAAESVPFERKLWRERNEEALKAMEKAGVTIHRIDREAFAAATAPMYTLSDGTRRRRTGAPHHGSGIRLATLDRLCAQSPGGQYRCVDAISRHSYWPARSCIPLPRSRHQPRRNLPAGVYNRGYREMRSGHLGVWVCTHTAVYVACASC